MMARRRSFRLLCVLLGTCTLSVALATGLPAAAGPLDGWSSNNVEFVRNIPSPHAGGSILRGRYFYVLHGSGLDVYDVSSPEDPQRISQLLFPARQTMTFVDPDTNGRILLASQAPSPEGFDLSVIDVTDKANPRVLSTLPGAGDHNMTCILDCTWAYGGSLGHIVDLRDPKNPVLHEELWSDNMNFTGEFGSYHDVTEVRPGIVLTASVPMYLLDVRKDPRHPRKIGRSDGSPHSYGGVVWPRGGRDRLVLSFAQPGVAAPSCRVREQLGGTTINSGFYTWDASRWQNTRLLTGLDGYAPADGTFTDGAPPASHFPFFGGCQAAWFDPHPFFRDGGLVVEAFGSYGVRFLQVARSGNIKEVGRWLGLGSSTAFTARWITHDIVYATHVDRGIDILRFKDAP